MTESSQNNKRIAKNTLLLYFRMLFMMAVQLYTSRVVLNTLGVEDYGIYNVVGGVVTMFGFLNAAMTTSTQRYITYELGKQNFERLGQVFVTSVNIHLLISLIIVILGETVGLWFLKEKMIIPESRMIAAMWVYQLSILTTVIAIMSYPYNAVIVAHERMSAFAYISVAEVVLKLVVVYLLVIGDFDKLILYAVLIALIQLLVRFFYSGYCARHFSETKYFFYKDKSLFREMLGFAGWNLWGNLAGILFSQGQNILLNMFFGPAVNAARAVAVQVQSAIQQFSANFQMALNPQITKTYAIGQLDNMHRLIYRSSKFTFFLLFTLCLPVLMETPAILRIWLRTVPEYTVIFLRIMILTMLVDSTANPLMVSAAATGRVKVYQSVVGGILLSIVPISYCVLKLGGEPWAVFVVHLVICCVAYVTRLFIVRPMIRLSVRQFVCQVILRCVIVGVLSAVIPVTLCMALPTGLQSTVLVIVAGLLSAGTCCFYVGLDRHERLVATGKIKQFAQKFISK
ncbi:MAG: oligosaccharide flippase family protein [Bacteroides sp.]|nr:oligosaccharide flippase family protein [Roseburia sp.]MCM1347421.1 oligosaccharide flippase family protein [Bacteroides sp.]MCM1421575.1 oligosaccharide flippase family protein [Bacteroides sp.]